MNEKDGKADDFIPDQIGYLNKIIREIEDNTCDLRDKLLPVLNSNEAAKASEEPMRDSSPINQSLQNVEWRLKVIDARLRDLISNLDLPDPPQSPSPTITSCKIEVESNNQ